MDILWENDFVMLCVGMNTWELERISINSIRTIGNNSSLLQWNGEMKKIRLLSCEQFERVYLEKIFLRNPPDIERHHNSN